MRYLLLVLTPPDLGPSARHALQFARAIARSEHEIACVFFFDAGALTARSSEAAPEEDDLRDGWHTLAREHGVHLVACVASAQRFGTAGDGQRQGEFEIAGLGALIEASVDADRVLTFRD
jgi:tRNA 2-thiouridine synthesizing protein D